MSRTSYSKVVARVPMSTKEEVLGAIQAPKKLSPNGDEQPTARVRCLFRLKS